MLWGFTQGIYPAWIPVPHEIMSKKVEIISSANVHYYLPLLNVHYNI